ncbi:MAG: DUF2760 domain-containing protein, partial [Gammaproteobacteria bacterium]
MNTRLYNIDLELIPTTIDLYHVYLLTAVFALALTVIILLFAMLIGLMRRSKQATQTSGTNTEQTISTTIPKLEPEVKFIEK